MATTAKSVVSLCNSSVYDTILLIAKISMVIFSGNFPVGQEFRGWQMELLFIG